MSAVFDVKVGGRDFWRDVRAEFVSYEILKAKQPVWDRSAPTQYALLQLKTDSGRTFHAQLHHVTPINDKAMQVARAIERKLTFVGALLQAEL